VVVGDKRPGRGTSGNGMQGWGFHLAESSPIEEGANGADDLDALKGPIEHLGVVDQVEVAVPEPKFDILHAAPLIGMGGQRFSQVMQLSSEHGQLAGARLAKLAI